MLSLPLITHMSLCGSMRLLVISENVSLLKDKCLPPSSTENVSKVCGVDLNKNGDGGAKR